jgi:uncharacterized iron-regulated membrane protein
MNLRKWHRKVSLIIALPLLLVVLSGLVLQLRNQSEWIQPKTVSAPRGYEVIHFNRLIQGLNISEKEVDQVIYRPGKNNISLRLKSGEEIQVDPANGRVLKRAMRRTGWLIELHQGSIFGSIGQYGIFFLTGIGMVFLIITGVMLVIPRRY